MSICQIEEREAGRPYPRTCPTCKLGGCTRGHDYKSMRSALDAIAAICEDGQEARQQRAYLYRENGMNAVANDIDKLDEIYRIVKGEG